MHLKQIDIYKTKEGEICISQENILDDDGGEFVYITPEMVDMVCNDLQKIKNELLKSIQEKM